MNATPDMTPAKSTSLPERAIAWAIPAVVVLAPFVLVYALAHPHIGQGYFVQSAALALLALHGLLLLAGRRELPRGFNLAGGLLLANLLLLAISVFTSGTVLLSLKKVMLPLAGLALSAMIVLSPLRPLILRRVGLALVGTSVLMACYGIAQYFGLEFLPYSSEVKKNTVIATVGHQFVGAEPRQRRHDKEQCYQQKHAGRHGQ